MNSSTSSFKHSEWKVLSVLAAAVLLLELLARILAPTLDYDRVHIHSFPMIAERMKVAEEPRIMILGNSLLMHGTDEKLLEKNISHTISSSCSISKVTPVGTAVRDWHYLYQTYFSQQEAHPDIVVIGFVAHHLPDQSELKMRRLARHFCSLKNLGDCLREEGSSFDSKAVGLLSHFSALYGDQPEHQWGVSSVTIPEFGRGVRKINNILDARQSASDPPRTYDKLTQLIRSLRKHGVKAYFVPMPQPRHWTIDPAAVAVIRENGAHLIDGRSIPGMVESEFSDGYHLAETGRTRFTRFLASRLSDELSTTAAPSP